MALRRRALLIHGWRVRDPMRSIGRLIEPLSLLGYEPLLLRYGYVLTKGATQFRTRKAAHNWAPRTEAGDVVVAHSNGCNLAWELSHDGDNRADTMIWVNPALDAECVPGRSVRRVLVLFNPGDWVVRLGGWLPDSMWGDMGRRGYCASQLEGFGADQRMSCSPHGHGHSDWRDPTGLAQLIHRFVSGNAGLPVVP